MKQRPILFSTAMVKAILALIKIMTRRTKGLEAINKNPNDWSFCWFGDTVINKKHTEFGVMFQNNKTLEVEFVKCLYGKPGDVLWIKESYFAFGEWEKNGKTKTGKQKWSFKRHWDADIQFKEPGTVMPNTYRKPAWYKRSSLFMEKDFARIWLKITDIRVERLQDISVQDAISEGIESIYTVTRSPGVQYKNYYPENKGGSGFSNPIWSFESLWHSINGTESWNNNPWVWVVSFQKIDKPE